MITKIKYRVLFFSIILTLIITGTINGQNNIRVVGVVVDNKGKPISDATVSLLYPSAPCESCFDEISPSFVTNKEGVFLLDSATKSKKVRILIEEFVPDGLWNAVFPVDVTLKRFSEFQGIIVKTPKFEGETIQLGEVSPHIKYRPISVDLLKVFNTDENFLKNSSSLKISLKYKVIKVVDDLLVHERAINRAENKLKFALPVGKWTLFFEDSNENQKRTGKVSVELR